MTTILTFDLQSSHISFHVKSHRLLSSCVQLRGVGIWGEGLFIFMELGSTANYFKGAGEQAHTVGDLGSTAKK